MKIVKVRHSLNIGSKEYTFKTKDDVKVGDIVVCDTAVGLTLGQVTEICTNAELKECKKI